ncbi:MAG: NfrA family protein [Pseudomonadota bacterium]
MPRLILTSLRRAVSLIFIGGLATVVLPWAARYLEDEWTRFRSHADHAPRISAQAPLATPAPPRLTPIALWSEALPPPPHTPQAPRLTLTPLWHDAGPVPPRRPAKQAARPRPLTIGLASLAAGSALPDHNAIGYAALQRGETRPALRAFEASLAANPDQSLIQRQVGYLKKQMGDHRGAVRAFGHALMLGGLAPAERIGLEREVSDLDKRFGLAAYTAWRSEALDRLELAALGASLGQSQSALEAAWRPELGHAANRHRLTFFARGLWGYAGDTLDPDGDSLQAGIGVRARPLPGQNLSVGLERLVALGAAARNDWMVRAAWSMGTGYAPPAEGGDWPFWSIYLDGALINPADPDLFLTGDARLGHGWRLDGAGRWMLTPFAAASGVVQQAGATTSLVEGGAGLWLRYRFNEGQGRAPASALDLRVEYRAKLGGDSPSGAGFLITLALAY